MLSMDLFLVWSHNYQLGVVMKGADIQLHCALSVILIGKSKSPFRSKLNQIFHWNMWPNFLSIYSHSFLSYYTSFIACIAS